MGAEDFLELNRRRAPNSGALSDRHRRTLEALPVPQPDPDSILHARTEALSLLLTEGRLIARDHGVDWPEELASAVLSYLQSIGYPVPVS